MVQKQKSEKIKVIFFSLLSLLIIGSAACVFYLAVFSHDSRQAMKEMSLSIKGQTVRAEIAETPTEQLKGLSDRPMLAPGKGMLFVFQNETEPGIWMKDMLFPLDIIWLNDNFQVVYIVPDVSPKSYPKIFQPQTPAQYVLETNAGFAANAGLRVGDTVQVLKS